MFKGLNTRHRIHEINLSLTRLKIKLRRQDLPADERQALIEKRNELVSERQALSGRCGVVKSRRGCADLKHLDENPKDIAKA